MRTFSPFATSEPSASHIEQAISDVPDERTKNCLFQAPPFADVPCFNSWAYFTSPSMASTGTPSAKSSIWSIDVSFSVCILFALYCGCGIKNGCRKRLYHVHLL